MQLGRSIGVSNYAYRMECETRINEFTLTGKTLEWFLEGLCEWYDVCVPDLFFNERDSRTRGYYRRTFLGDVKEIVLNESGNIHMSTLVHEFVHHLNHEMDDGWDTGHGVAFKERHEDVLEDLIDGIEIDGIEVNIERIRKEAHLDYLHELYPTEFEAFWQEDIHIDELIGAIERAVSR